MYMCVEVAKGGRGRPEGDAGKQPGFIVTSHVTFTAGWQVFRRDRKEDGAGPLTLVTDGGEEDGERRANLWCGGWGSFSGGGDLDAADFKS